MIPPGSLLIGLLIGYFASKTKSFKRSGTILMLLSFLSLYALSTSYVGNHLMYSLESDFVPLEDVNQEIDAVVVLTAGVQILQFGDKKFVRASSGTLMRLLEGIHFHKQLKKPLVITGGSGDPARKDTAEAPLVKDFLREIEIAEKDIIIESKSRNTEEEARYTAQLFDKRHMKKRIVLCTHAFHMKRASDLFKSEGFEVLSAPIGHSSQAVELHINNFMPHAGNLMLSTTAISEYLIYYGSKALKYLGLR